MSEVLISFGVLADTSFCFKVDYIEKRFAYWGK